MPLLAEYALTPDVFDMTSYSNEEVCGLHLQVLKEVLLQEGIVRDLRNGQWGKQFVEGGRAWHLRGKELLKKLVSQKRLVPAVSAYPQAPVTDADWCNEAIASHVGQALVGIIVTDSVLAPHKGNPAVASISKLSSATWWAARSSSVRLARTLADYEGALDLVLRHANSLMFIDPYFDPTDAHQYGDLLKLLERLKDRTDKPLVELHRAAWYGGGHDKRPQVKELVEALTPQLAACASRAGVSFDIFLWDDMHDRYLISDIIGISLPYGFATTKAPNNFTTWTRLGRSDRDDIQREFDPASNRHTLRYRFKVP
jgi:hypothetical protein